MLPAPTTTAISTSRERVLPSCSAIRSTREASVPYSRSPISASPESFRRTRWNFGSSKAIALAARGPGLFPPDPEVGKARDAHVLAGLVDDVLPHLLDRLALVLVDVDVLLLEQRHRLLPLGELSADDPLDDLVGLSVLARRLLEHPPLRLAL